MDQKMMLSRRGDGEKHPKLQTRSVSCHQTMIFPGKQLTMAFRRPRLPPLEPRVVQRWLLT